MHDLVGVYALDALEPEEVDAFELHLAECPKCRAELRDHRETAALLAHAGASAPAGVWDRIAAELEDEPTGAGTVFPIGRARRARPGLRRFAMAAAAVAATVIGVNSAVLMQQQDDLARLKPSAAASLRALAEKALDDPTSRVATLRRSDGAVAAEAVVTKDGRGYLLHPAMPDLDASRAYQLWGLTQYGSPVSLGVLGGNVRIASFIAKLPVSELAITVEKAAGASTPTGVPLLRGALQAT